MSVLFNYNYLNSLQINGSDGIGPSAIQAPTTSVTFFAILKLFNIGNVCNVVRIGNAAGTKKSCRFAINTAGKVWFVNNTAASPSTATLSTGKWYAVCVVWRIADADPNIDYYVRDLSAKTTTSNSVNSGSSTWYTAGESLIGSFLTNTSPTYSFDGNIECLGIWLEALASPGSGGEALFNTYADSLAGDKTLTNLGTLSTPVFYDPLTPHINKILDPVNDPWSAQVGSVTITPYYRSASTSARRPIGSIGHELPLAFEKPGSSTSWTRPTARFHPYPYHCTMTFAHDMHSLDYSSSNGFVFDNDNTRKLWTWWNTSKNYFNLGPGPNLETSFSCWMANTDNMMDSSCRTLDNFSYFQKDSLSTERSPDAATLRQAFQDEIVDSFHDYFDDHTQSLGCPGAPVPISFDQVNHPQAVINVFKNYNITFPRCWISHGNDYMGLAYPGTANKLGDEPGSWYHLDKTRTTAATEAPGIGGAWWTWDYYINSLNIGGTPDLIWESGSQQRLSMAIYPYTFDDGVTKTYFFSRQNPNIIFNIDGTTSDDYGKFVNLADIYYLVVKTNQIGSYAYNSNYDGVLIYNNGTNPTNIGYIYAVNYEAEVDINGNVLVGGAYCRWQLSNVYRDFTPTVTGNFDLKFKLVRSGFGNDTENFETAKDHFDTDILDRHQREGALAILYEHPEYINGAGSQDQIDAYNGLMELSSRFHNDKTIFVGSLNRVCTLNLISNFITYTIQDLGSNNYKITLDTTFDDNNVFTGSDIYNISASELRGLTFFRPSNATVQLWFNGSQVNITHNDPFNRPGHIEDGAYTFSVPYDRISSTIFGAASTSQSTSPVFSRSSGSIPNGTKIELSETPTDSPTYYRIYKVDTSPADYYPITIISDDDISLKPNILSVTSTVLEMWLPPNQDFKIQYKFGEAGTWSTKTSFQSTGYLNSFDKFRILSGYNISSANVTETSRGAIISNE